MSDQITVVGTVVNDPERRQTPSGITVINFRLATNVRRRDEASGAWVDGHTNWYAVSAYRGLAEHALESLRKGHRVIVSGSFKLRQWEANGRQGMAAEIDAASLGHDLLWGTTVYRREERRTDEGGGSRPGGQDATTSHGTPTGEGDTWAPVPSDDPTPF